MGQTITLTVTVQSSPNIGDVYQILADGLAQLNHAQRRQTATVFSRVVEGLPKGWGQRKVRPQSTPEKHAFDFGDKEAPWQRMLNDLYFDFGDKTPPWQKARRERAQEETKPRGGLGQKIVAVAKKCVTAILW